jgi:hypothetical protein
MKHLLPLKPLLFSLVLLICFTSCSKEDINEDVTSITVELKSTSVNYDKVYLDVVDVQFKVMENGDVPNAWLSLNTINQGTFNACDLNEDSPLMLVDHLEIESTFIHEIRLVLGDNNFMDVNGLLMSLDVSHLGNAIPSNLIRTELESNRSYDFIIDINIDESISFNEAENMMVLNPKIYTAIRQFEY